MLVGCGLIVVGLDGVPRLGEGFDFLDGCIECDAAGDVIDVLGA